MVRQICYTVTSWLLILLLSIGCSENDQVAMQLQTVTVQSIFDTGQPFLYTGENGVYINIFCHVVEGSWCYFVTHEQIEAYNGKYDPTIEQPANQLAEEQAKRIIDEIGMEFIAQSQNHSVKIRCLQVTSKATISCQIDRGGGWQIVNVR